MKKVPVAVCPRYEDEDPMTVDRMIERNFPAAREIMSSELCSKCSKVSKTKIVQDPVSGDRVEVCADCWDKNFALLNANPGYHMLLNEGYLFWHTAHLCGLYECDRLIGAGR